MRVTVKKSKPGAQGLGRVTRSGTYLLKHQANTTSVSHPTTSILSLPKQPAPAMAPSVMVWAGDVWDTGDEIIALPNPSHPSPVADRSPLAQEIAERMWIEEQQYARQKKLEQEEEEAAEEEANKENEDIADFTFPEGFGDAEDDTAQQALVTKKKVDAIRLAMGMTQMEKSYLASALVKEWVVELPKFAGKDLAEEETEAEGYASDDEATIIDESE